MPKYSAIALETSPFQFKGASLRMGKAFTSQDFRSNTVLTNDIYSYVDFFFNSKAKVMKYEKQEIVEKYGKAQIYHYSFYWKQSEEFYRASKAMSIESSPLLSYYAMLNAAKALIAYRCKYVDDFCDNFKNHGLSEDTGTVGNSLQEINVKRKDRGVFVKLANLLHPDVFGGLWNKATSISLKDLLCELSFIHRAFVTTYTSPRKKVQDRFIPLTAGSAPIYYKANDGSVYLTFEIDKPIKDNEIPNEYMRIDSLKLRSKSGAKTTKDSISNELKTNLKNSRLHFQYIRSTQRLWYLKKYDEKNTTGKLNSMILIMAAMHRFSEIVRYKPEQMKRLMESKENWLIHEFLSLALDQFIDEISAEITGRDIMCTGVK